MSISELERQVLAHPILTCRFLETIAQGSFSDEEIKLWVTQQYYFSSQFPRCLAALYARIEDYEISRPLMTNFLAVEHWGTEHEGAHWKLYQKVLSFFGLSASELKEQKPLEETEKYLKFRMQVCLTGTPEEALGNMAFAHEFVNSKIFDFYYKGIRKVRGMTDNVAEYFKVHVTDDVGDYEVLRDIIVRGYNTPASMELVKKGALAVLDARLEYFDNLFKRFKS